MTSFTLTTWIRAPVDRCFDLTRDERIHPETTIAIAGTAGGTIDVGQTVTFDGRHFGIRRRFTLQVVEARRPHFFVDEMIGGVFTSFTHSHEFISQAGGTLMRDTLTWTTPFGVLGRIVDRLLIERHIKRLVLTRNARLKQIAESTPR